MVKIAATMVGTTGERFRTITANKERLELAQSIATHVQGDGRADIVLLPAGFLAAEDKNEARRLARKLASIFDKVALFAGIDQDPDLTEGSPRNGKGTLRTGKARNRDKAKTPKTDSDGFPFWAFASEAGTVTGGLWEQRAIDSGVVVSDTTARCVRAGDSNIGLLICGELYNRDLTDSLAAAKPDLVVNLAHRSMKRFTKSLARVAETVRRDVYHVQHVALTSRYPSKWKATPRGGAKRDTRSDWASHKLPIWKRGDLWAEVKIWTA